eukprot:2691467-Karenia_brevis.AAC.1
MHSQLPWESLDSNSAEMTAMMCASLWILSNFESLSKVSVIYVCYDSKFAANITQALWTSMQEPLLTSVANSLWVAVQSLTNATMCHVHAHDGHPLNELADSCCSAASRMLLTLSVPSIP